MVTSVALLFLSQVHSLHGGDPFLSVGFVDLQNPPGSSRESPTVMGVACIWGQSLHSLLILHLQMNPGILNCGQLGSSNLPGQGTMSQVES